MWKYCTKEEVADFSGLAASGLKDTWSLVVEGMIDEHTGQSFGGTSTYTETLDGDGVNDTIILRHAPISSVTSLTIDSVDLSSTEYKVYEAGYIRLVSVAGSSLDRATGSSGTAFPEGQQNITVVYVANQSTVPAFVKLAAILCIEEIALYYERAGASTSLAVSRATQRAGESAGNFFGFPTGLAAKLRYIIRDTIGQKWRFS